MTREKDSKLMDYQSIALTTVSETLWRLSIKSGPANLITPTFVSELGDFVRRVEMASALKVVIFESGIEDFFLNHFDLSQAALFPGGREKPVWVDLVLALTNSPVIPSRQYAAGRAEAGTNSRWHAICVTRAGKRRFSGSPR